MIIKYGIVLNDPELRYSMSGLSICTFNLSATDNVDYKIVCFAELADFLAKNLKKDDDVRVWGYFKTIKWKDRNKVERSSIEFRIKKIRKN